MKPHIHEAKNKTFPKEYPSHYNETLNVQWIPLLFCKMYIMASQACTKRRNQGPASIGGKFSYFQNKPHTNQVTITFLFNPHLHTLKVYKSRLTDQ